MGGEEEEGGKGLVSKKAEKAMRRRSMGTLPAPRKLMLSVRRYAPLLRQVQGDHRAEVDCGRIACGGVEGRGCPDPRLGANSSALIMPCFFRALGKNTAFSVLRSLGCVVKFAAGLNEESIVDVQGVGRHSSIAPDQINNTRGTSTG